MRLQMDGRAKDTGPSGALAHIDARRNERITGPRFGTARDVGIDVADQPGLEPALDLLGGLQRTGQIAADDLDVMGKARDAQHRVELRRQPGIGIGRRRGRAHK